jgi:hypothetical protein
VTLRNAPTRYTVPEGYRHLERNLALDINQYPLSSEQHKLPKQ